MGLSGCEDISRKVGCTQEIKEPLHVAGLESFFLNHFASIYSSVPQAEIPG